jgi:hypothetical protein
MNFQEAWSNKRAIMNTMNRTICVTIVSVTFVLTTGCQTPEGRTDNTTTGALLGGLIGAGTGALIGNAAGHHTAAGAAIGGVVGLLAGGIIGHMTDAQKTQVQQQSPQTWNKLQSNDAAYAASPTPSAPSATSSASSETVSTTSSATPPQMQPLTVDDIKALASAGVRDDVVTSEIQRSNSKFSQQDVTALQQAGVSSGVIDFIRTNAAS